MRRTSWRTIASSRAPVETTCEMSASGREDSVGDAGQVDDRVGPGLRRPTSSTATGSVQSSDEVRAPAGQVDPDHLVAERRQSPV